MLGNQKFLSGIAAVKRIAFWVSCGHDFGNASFGYTRESSSYIFFPHAVTRLVL